MVLTLVYSCSRYTCIGRDHKFSSKFTLLMERGFCILFCELTASQTWIKLHITLITDYCLLFNTITKKWSLLTNCQCDVTGLAFELNYAIFCILLKLFHINNNVNSFFIYLSDILSSIKSVISLSC